MANEWFYSKSGKRFGPVSGQQLKELATKGELGPGDQVWKDGMAKWIPAKSIKGLFDSVTASPPPPAPQQLVEPGPVPELQANGPRPHGLMPVIVTQSVIAAIGFLFGFWGIIELGPSDLRSLNGLFICVGVGWNLGVLATTWLGYLQKSYWFSITSARLMFGSWFFFLFTGCPIPVSILGLMVSIPVGIWAISTLRKPDVRAFLGMNSQPLDFSTTLLGPTLGNKWAGFTGKQRAITLGVGSATLLLFVVVVWLLQSNQSPRPYTPPGGSPFSKNDKPATSKASDQEEENLIQKADELWTNGKKHDAADIYQSILDKHGGLFHGKAASSRVYSRTIDSLVERAGPGAVHNYIKMATIARVTLVLSNPEARKLAGDAAAKEQEFLTSPPSEPTDKGESGGPDNQGNRDRIEAKLQGLKLNALIGKYGRPDSIWANPKRSNVKLYIWHLGGSSTDVYVVQLVIHAIDGRSPDIEENAKVLTANQLDRLKSNLSNAVK
jgi:hypothetical protein